jgi:uncharacterized phage protein (TIGR02218 family)
MKGLPELYDLEYAGEFDRVTSWPKEISFLGNTYTPAPIKRSAFNFDHEFSSVKTTINAPMMDAFIRYIANTPIEPTRVTIYRAVEDDLTQYRTLFTGFVMYMSVKDKIVSAHVEANSELLDTVIPRFMFQSWCNHEVFDGQCGISAINYAVSASVNAISGAVYTCPEAGYQTDDYYTGGVAEAGTDMRMITDHTGSNLTLQVPFDTRVGVGDSITIYPGCDGSPDTCRDKFDNFPNFLGMPYIPSKNPVIWGLNP